MKQALTIGILLLLSFTLTFGQTNQEKMFYRSKAFKYEKMKKTGTILGIFGGVITISGIVLIGNADWEENTQNNGYYQNGYYYTNNYNNNTTTTDSNGVLGILGVMVGVPMTTAGIILNVIGGRKQREYQRKADGISLGYFQKSGAHGLSVAIKL
ncbi:MAG TPA: hypothetical protein PKL31_18110 [Fulvivirga sp.]|nr:hypothetical protein [Fulvivirga sp.]